MLGSRELRIERLPDETVRITCPPLHPELSMELRTLVDCHALYRFSDRTVFIIAAGGLERFQAAYGIGGAPALVLPTTMIVYYDYVSPYSYLSTRIAEILAGEYDLWVEWRGLELRPAWVEFPAWWYQPTASGQRWIERRDLVRKYGLPMADNRPAFRPRTRPLLKAGEYAKARGKFEQFQRTVFEAYYGRAEDIRSANVVAQLAEKVGLPRGEVLHAMMSETWEDTIEGYRREAERDGIFGVPTYKIGDAILWGRDPIDDLRRALDSAGARKL